MLSPARFHRIYRQSAVYDIALSAPFAVLPGVHAITWAFDYLSQSCGFGPMPPLDPYEMMYANFFGTIVTIWALLRLKLDLPWLARWDAVGRMFFSLAMVLALFRGATLLLWPILIIELTWGILQLLPVHGHRWTFPERPS